MIILISKILLLFYNLQNFIIYIKMDYNPKLTISKNPLFELEVNYDSLK